MGLGKWVGQPICGTLWHYTQVFKILLLKNMGSSRRLSGDLYVDLQQGDFQHHGGGDPARIPVVLRKCEALTCGTCMATIALSYGDGSKPWYLVNPKIAGKWMFIPLKMVLIGIDPYPYIIILPTLHVSTCYRILHMFCSWTY